LEITNTITPINIKETTLAIKSHKFSEWVKPANTYPENQDSEVTVKGWNKRSNKY
jgi:hypothetical protein